MIRMCARNSHSYTHLVLALGIVRKPTVWGFITSRYPGTHDMTLACLLPGVLRGQCRGVCVPPCRHRPQVPAYPLHVAYKAVHIKDTLHIKHSKIRNICRVSLLCRALYATLLIIPVYLLLSMQSSSPVSTYPRRYLPRRVGAAPTTTAAAAATAPEPVATAWAKRYHAKSRTATMSIDLPLCLY